MEKDLLIVAILLAVVTLTFSCCLVSLKKELEELKKDVTDTMRYICDIEIRLEKELKRQKENNNGNTL